MVLCTLLTLAFTSCKKEEVINSNEKGSFTIEFENKVNGVPLVLNTQNYQNSNGESFNISTFKYYVSNIRLTKADGSFYTIPESYFLIDAAKLSSLLNNIKDIPAGDYTKISFIIGVDKERNLAGAQTGALDPRNVLDME